MARVARLASLALVTLKIRSERSRHREDDLLADKNAPPLAKALLHHRRAAAMADDERAALPHRICERQVNLSRMQWRNSRDSREDSVFGGRIQTVAQLFPFSFPFLVREIQTRNLRGINAKTQCHYCCNRDNWRSDIKSVYKLVPRFFLELKIYLWRETRKISVNRVVALILDELEPLIGQLNRMETWRLRVAMKPSSRLEIESKTLICTFNNSAMDASLFLDNHVSVIQMWVPQSSISPDDDRYPNIRVLCSYVSQFSQ